MRMTRVSAAFLAAALCGALPTALRAADAPVRHTVRPGDNLHLVAGYYFKDPRQWKRVWKENRKRIPKPGILKPGTELALPAGTAADWDLTYEQFAAEAMRRGR